MINPRKLSAEDEARIDKLFVAVLNGLLVRTDMPIPPAPMPGTSTQAGALAIIAYARVADTAILMTLTALERIDRTFAAAERIATRTTTKEESHDETQEPSPTAP